MRAGARVRCQSDDDFQDCAREGLEKSAQAEGKVMTAAERKRIAYERHRRFLFKVTGLTFSAAFPDYVHDGIGFRYVIAGLTERGVEPVEIVSVIRDREDLFR